jgi:hypothetical protein
MADVRQASPKQVANVLVVKLVIDMPTLLAMTNQTHLAQRAQLMRYG